MSCIQYNFASCSLCPRKCGADRTRSLGVCGETVEIRAARAALHFGEEPCISGVNGSGTVFFCGCPLRCIFCQNGEISHGANAGFPLSEQQLAEVFLQLQAQGAHNINLVTPTHFAVQICSALKFAREKGLKLPIVCNSSGYESETTVQLFAQNTDVFLPDFKFFSSEKASLYCAASDYPQVAMHALELMVAAKPRLVFDKDGMLLSGVMVRHLVLPKCTNDAINILKQLFERFGNSIAYSLMSQYTPVKPLPYANLNRTLFPREYEKVVDFALSLGIEHGYLQSTDSTGEQFIPLFDGTGISQSD